MILLVFFQVEIKYSYQLFIVINSNLVAAQGQNFLATSETNEQWFAKLTFHG